MDAGRMRAIEIMERFADRTGLASGRPPRRYLWTDAFAVRTLHGLGDSTGEPHYRELAGLEARGGRVSGTVSRETDYLVVGEAPGRKLEQARELGIPTLGAARLRSLLARGC